MIKITDQKVLEYLKKIIDIGGQPYIVGGYVRDFYLNKKATDIDIEVFNVTYQQMVDIFNKEAIIYDKFGVFHLKNTNVEFTLPRLEVKNGLYHHDFIIKFNKNLSIKKAIKRRDFTINSLMYDIINDKLIDEVNGLNDLKNKKIVHHSIQFIDDPLRILRALHFSMQLNFEIDNSTKIECIKMLDQLKYISSNKKNSEIKKIFTSNNEKKNYQEVVFFLNKYFHTNNLSDKYLNKLEKINSENYFIIAMCCLLINTKKEELDIILNDFLINKKEINLIKKLLKAEKLELTNQNIIEINSVFQLNSQYLVEFISLKSIKKAQYLENQ